MSKGGYKIFDQGGMYFVSFAVVAGLTFYKKGIPGCSDSKFAALPAGARSYNLWMVYNE